VPGEPPLIVLGVRRSGTTLLRVMLDRNRALAVPDESYFVPQLARRHRGSVDPAAFLDDLRRLPTLVEWGLSVDAVAPRLRPGMTTGTAICACMFFSFEYTGRRAPAARSCAGGGILLPTDRSRIISGRSSIESPSLLPPRGKASLCDACPGAGRRVRCGVCRRAMSAVPLSCGNSRPSQRGPGKWF